jgi:hypothetical protein
MRSGLVLGGTPSDASLAESMPARGLVAWRSLNRPGFGGVPWRERTPLDFLPAPGDGRPDLIVGISGGSYHAFAYARHRTSAFVVIVAGMVPRPFFDLGLDSCRHRDLFVALGSGFEAWRQIFRRSPAYDRIVSSCGGPLADRERGIYEELRLLYRPWEVSLTGIEGVWFHPADDANVPLESVKAYLAASGVRIDLRVIPGTHDVSLDAIFTAEAVRSWTGS